MSCGGRVYKGDTVTISVPFDVSGYTNLTITYSTTGNSMIVKDESEVIVEDGFISYTFSGHELDLLPDGVIYYTIDCEVEGEDYVASTNTPLYLATPAGYSGLTADEIYQQGYEDGLEHCSGYTPCDCTSAVTEAFQSGYTQGYAQGQEDCPECSGSTCNIQPKTLNLESGDTGNWFVEPDDGYDGLSELTVKDDGYGQMKFDSGYTQGYSTGYDRGYDSGYEDGEDDCPNLQYSKNYSATTLQATIFPNAGYDGVKRINLDTTSVYNMGYAAGQADCPECSGSTDCSSAVTEAYELGHESGYTDGYNSGYTEGFDSGYTTGIESCDCSAAYADGYSAGYAQGQEDCPECSGTSCNLQTGGISLINIQDTYYPSSGYDGFSSFYVDASTFEMEAYTHGYNDGLSQSGCNLENVTTAMSIYSSDIHVYPSSGYAGMSHVYVDASSMRNYSYESGVTDGFSSGYESGSTDGFVNGYQSGATDGWYSGYSDGYSQGQADCPECDCTSAYTQGFNDGYQSGYTDGVADSSSAITEALQSGYTQGYNDGLVACSSSGTGPGNINTLLVLFSGATRIETFPNGRPLICSGYSLIQPCDNPPCEVDELNPLGEGTNTVSIGMSGTWPVPNLNLQKNGFSIGVSTEDLANWNNNWTVLGVVFNGDIFTQAQGEYVEGGIELVPSSVTTSPYDADFTLVNISFQ